MTRIKRLLLRGRHYLTYVLVFMGFRVWAKISNDPEGRKVMVFELKKVLQYVN